MSRTTTRYFVVEVTKRGEAVISKGFKSQQRAFYALQQAVMWNELQHEGNHEPLRKYRLRKAKQED